MKDIYCSVIVPCFNEQDVLPKTCERLKSILESGFPRHEIIFINDGSRDSTLSLIKNFCAKDPSVKCVSFSRNFGHQAAVTAGIRHCSGDVGIIIDADLQDPPECIPDMVRQWRETGASVIYAVRKKRKGEGIFKRLSARIFYRLLNTLSDIPIPNDTGDFRLIDRKVISEFCRLPEHAKFVRGLISWLGFRQEPFYYERAPRAAGETKYPLRKMVGFAVTGITGFSRKPLRMALSLGGLSIFICFLLVLYVFGSMLFFPDRTVPGWASTLIIIIFFSGIQLVTIGVLGEYLGRIFDEVKGRPEYIVSETLNMEIPKR